MKYLTPAEVAALTGLTPQAVRMLCRQGLVPGAVPPNREWQIPASSVKKMPVRAKGVRGPGKKKRDE